MPGEDFPSTYPELLDEEGNILSKYVPRLRDGFMQNKFISVMPLNELDQIRKDSDWKYFQLGLSPVCPFDIEAEEFRKELRGVIMGNHRTWWLQQLYNPNSFATYPGFVFSSEYTDKNFGQTIQMTAEQFQLLA